MPFSFFQVTTFWLIVVYYTMGRHIKPHPSGAVTEVTRISVQSLYFINHTPRVLYNQKYKEYEIPKNVEISTK